MQRRKMIAGNWKMNGLLEDGVMLAQNFANLVKSNGKPQCEFVLCPPATLLFSIKKVVRGKHIAVGAQDVHFAEKGAHTGDISAPMLKNLGCTYVIVGHSERRADHGETDEIVCKKAAAAHNAGLKTIICVGETLAEREAGQAVEVCRQQIAASVPADSIALNTVIAYEPIWAIGTGKIPTPEDVKAVHAAVRSALEKKMGCAEAGKVRILYGGSVKPSNAGELLNLENVDGALVGGASLNAQDFFDIACNGGCY